MSDRINIFNYNGSTHVRDIGNKGHGRTGNIRAGRFEWWSGNAKIKIAGQDRIVDKNSYIDWLISETAGMNNIALPPLTRWTFFCESGTDNATLQQYTDLVIKNLSPLTYDLRLTKEKWTFAQGKAEFDAGQYARALFYLEGRKDLESRYMMGVSHLELGDTKGLGEYFLNEVAKKVDRKGCNIPIGIKAHLKLGEYHLTKKNLARATECYHWAAQKGSKEACLWLKDHYATTGDKSLSYFFHLKAAKIESNPDKFVPGTKVLIEAQNAFNNKDYELVIALLVDRATLYVLRYWMGVSCCELSKADPSLEGMWDAGISFLKKAVPNGGALIYLGDIEMTNNNPDAAAQFYGQVASSSISTPEEVIAAQARLMSL